ncbi:unnamed protein product, partial [Urochloa humidicola]
GQSLYHEGRPVRCTADALNGTDVRGQIVLCVGLQVPPLVFLKKKGPPLVLVPLALKNVLDAGASGLIFAQYIMDVLVQQLIAKAFHAFLWTSTWRTGLAITWAMQALQ